jgi:hypothetical protein
MRRTCLTKPTSMIAGLLVGLLFATLTVPLGAETAPKTRVGKGFGVPYDAAHEITLSGNIEQVINNKHAVGTPAGMHLLVAGPKGMVDAQVGPFLPKATREALHTGTPVEIVGARMEVRGKSYLVARELKFGGTTVEVRNKHGFLVRFHGTPARLARNKAREMAKVELNGGAR